MSLKRKHRVLRTVASYGLIRFSVNSSVKQPQCQSTNPHEKYTSRKWKSICIWWCLGEKHDGGGEHWHMLFVLLLTLGKGEIYKERNTEKIRMTERERERPWITRTFQQCTYQATINIEGVCEINNSFKKTFVSIYWDEQSAQTLFWTFSMKHLMRKTHFTSNQKHVQLKIMINDMSEHLLENSALMG